MESLIIELHDMKDDLNPVYLNFNQIQRFAQKEWDEDIPCTEIIFEGGVEVVVSETVKEINNILISSGVRIARKQTPSTDPFVQK